MAFFVVAVGLVLASRFMLPSRWPAVFRDAVFIATALRIVGSTVRLWVVTDYYGRGDAFQYYGAGLTMAEGLWKGEAAAFLAAPQWWGTPFVERISAIVLFFIGPSIRAEFVVFSVFPLAGLVLILITFFRSFPGRINIKKTTWLVLFWPSLVFWPSSVGKESLILLAVGLSVYGYAGSNRGVKWGFLVAGLLLASGIRPHIAMMIAVSLVAAEWMGPLEKFTLTRAIRAVGLLVIAVYTVRTGLTQFSLDATPDAVQGFVDFRSGQTAQGGSRFAATDGVFAVPMAFINVMLRPFPWQISNPLVAFSALEVLVFWAIVWRRRRDIGDMIRRWRSSRLLLFVVPLTAVLIVFYGAFISNVGILARQRVVVLPFLFLLAECAPAFRNGSALLRAPLRVRGGSAAQEKSL